VNSRKLAVLAAVGFAYFIAQSFIDPRLADGALEYSEMFFWEYPILAMLLLSVFVLWYRGLKTAIGRGAVPFVLALFVWPYSVFLALRPQS
jgi:hypothetical protein